MPGPRRSHVPSVLGVLALFVAVAFTAAAGQRAGSFADLQPTVILVSFDGFRWDYPSKVPMPNLRRLMARGVHAENLIPSFPSKTFPNHYSIVTGLYPGHHGIVANNIFDPPTGRMFTTANATEVQDPMWWGGTPIWTAVERAGKASAPMFWPGSEAPHDGVMPHYWRRYDENRPARTRIADLFSWLDLPASQRPVLLTVYFEDTDSAGHQRGPDSVEVREAIRRVDGYLGDIVNGLSQRGILDRVNVVVVSDHGMAAVNDTRVIVTDDFFSTDQAVIADINPHLGVFPKPGQDAAVYQALLHADPHLKTYRTAELPERWHLGGPRVPPIYAVSDEGWQVVRRTTLDGIKAGKIAGARGQHGYDPQLMSMRAFFAAAGPAFKSGTTVAPFENVSLYNVFAKILGVTPAPNDGDPAVVSRLLR